MSIVSGITPTLDHMRYKVSMSKDGGEYIARIAEAHGLPESWAVQPLLRGKPIGLGLDTVLVHDPAPLHAAITRAVQPLYEFEELIVGDATGQPPLRSRYESEVIDGIDTWFESPDLYRAMPDPWRAGLVRLKTLAVEVIPFSQEAISRKAAAELFGGALHSRTIPNSRVPLKVTAILSRNFKIVDVCHVGLHAVRSELSPSRAFVVGRVGKIAHDPARSPR